MEVVSLNNEADHGFILVDWSTGLPCIGASIWISLYENKFSDSYMRKKLHAISKFYDHVSERVIGPYGLDDLLIQKKFDRKLRRLLSILDIHRHNWDIFLLSAFYLPMYPIDLLPINSSI